MKTGSTQQLISLEDMATSSSSKGDQEYLRMSGWYTVHRITKMSKMEPSYEIC